MAPADLNEAAQHTIIAQAEASFAARPAEQLESERDAGSGYDPVRLRR